MMTTNTAAPDALTYTGPDSHSSSTAQAADTARHDRYAEYSHQLPEDTSDRMAGLFKRIIPWVYAVILGVAIGDFTIALIFAIAVSVGFDLATVRGSVILRFYRKLRRSQQ